MCFDIWIDCCRHTRSVCPVKISGAGWLQSFLVGRRFRFLSFSWDLTWEQALGFHSFPAALPPSPDMAAEDLSCDFRNPGMLSSGCRDSHFVFSYSPVSCCPPSWSHIIDVHKRSNRMQGDRLTLFRINAFGQA